jgi:hypothetical protein
MLQKITEAHRLDENENLTGGQTTAVGISIQWQDGPLGLGLERKEPNGAFVEGVIQSAIGRLAFFQTSKFACRENALALTKLQEALHWLQHRTMDRQIRGIEGTHAV